MNHSKHQYGLHNQNILKNANVAGICRYEPKMKKY